MILLDSGASYGKRDYFGMTPLAWAVVGGFMGCMHVLLDVGADADSVLFQDPGSPS